MSHQVTLSYKSRLTDRAAERLFARVVSFVFDERVVPFKGRVTDGARVRFFSSVTPFVMM